MRTLMVIIAGLVLGGALTAAAPASAVRLDGAAAFLAAEHPQDTYWGDPASDKQLLDIGRTACSFHERGLSDVDVFQRMIGGPSMMPPHGSEAERLGVQRIRNAVRFLCP